MLQVPEMSEAAGQLRSRGYAILKGYKEEDSSDAQRAFTGLLSKWGSETLRNFTFEIDVRKDGRYEPDDGYLDWAVKQSTEDRALLKDVKRMFHYRTGL